VERRSCLLRMLGGTCLVLGAVVGYGAAGGVLVAGPGSAAESAGTSCFGCKASAAYPTRQAMTRARFG
jgi:hypothetical protein